jgi:hypothetical protein
VVLAVGVQRQTVRAGLEVLGYQDKGTTGQLLLQAVRVKVAVEQVLLQLLELAALG